MTAENVAAYLGDQGFGACASGARELAGGVSATVLSVDCGGRAVVVKQPLPHLKVREVWAADVARAADEADALALAAPLLPGRTPSVLAFDPANHVLVIERAPVGWRVWQDELSAGRFDRSTAAWMGETMAALHAGTAGDPDVAARFGDLAGFRSLRIAPFHETVAERCPEIAAAVHEQIAELVGAPTCLVHGDFAPKNMLVGDDGAWILDWEVAHWGNPVFDAAFATSFLVLTAIARPQDAGALRALARVFVERYAASGGLAPTGPELARHTGTHLVARAVGKSPATFLDAAQRETARRVGVAAILAGAPSVDGLFDRPEPAA